MQNPDLLLRTDIHDQRDPGWTRRGSRYWSQAELHGEMFFIVEGRFKDNLHARPQRFITADLSEALQIPEQYELKQTDLLACVLGLDGQRRLDSVVEAYVDSATDQIAVKLSSGEVVLGTGSAAGQKLSRGIAVFPKRAPDSAASGRSNR